MRTLVIPDIHNQVDKAEFLIDKEKPDETIFLGDYFDDFGDDRRDALKTAEWLKRSILDPKRIHLLGNHDLWYLLAPADKWFRPKKGNEWMRCSGNTPSKFNTIRRALEDVDLSMLRLFYKVQGFYCTHAGMREELFARPFVGFDKLEEDCRSALAQARLGIYTEILGAGKARGGRQEYGGLTWLDWNEEFQPIEGISQICGHTRSNAVRTNSGKDSENYCLDTHLQHYGIIEHGQVLIKEFVALSG